MGGERGEGISKLAAQQSSAPVAAPGRRVIESAALLAGSRELLIRHGGEVYTLRQTSKGKLILTK